MICLKLLLRSTQTLGNRRNNGLPKLIEENNRDLLLRYLKRKKL